MEDIRSIIIARAFLSAGFQVAQARPFEDATMYQYVCCKSQAETGLRFMRRVNAAQQVTSCRHAYCRSYTSFIQKVHEQQKCTGRQFFAVDPGPAIHCDENGLTEPKKYI